VAEVVKSLGRAGGDELDDNKNVHGDFLEFFSRFKSECVKPNG